MNETSKLLETYITRDETRLKNRMCIPGDMLLFIFNTSDLQSFISGDRNPIFKIINKYFKFEEATSSLDDNGLVVEWDISIEHVDLKPYFINFPSPIPKVYKIPLKILQGLLRTPEYSVIIEKTGDTTFKAKRNMIGVYGKDLTVDEIETSVSVLCRKKVKLVKMENREFIFMIE